MEKYDPQKVEPKWQQKWQEWRIHETPDPPGAGGKEKLYVLDMFPYPSGAGLHVGHTRIYTASDVLARYFRMKDYNVLHPMGWDAFGLPAENDAIKKKVNPNQLVPKNIATFKKQMQSLGFSYDWSREFSTADPSYYKWTQWLFLQFFKMGLLYQKKVPINWCEHCQSGLANEEVLTGGIHERCGKPVVKREMKQWLFKITKYADRLLNDLEGLDWPPSILEMQRNWIGRSEGTEIDFPLSSLPALPATPALPSPITVFTTRPDTLFGVTALVLAPEHSLVQSLINPYQPLSSLNQPLSSSRNPLSSFNYPLNSSNDSLASFRNEVRKYVKASRRKSDLERADLIKEKSGVFTGLYATNPANGGRVPVWVADYVIGWYGGGAVMLVPAHDQRDFEFAKKYDLPIKVVVDSFARPGLAGGKARPCLAYEGEGILVDSDEFTGLSSETARERITDWLEEKGFGRKTVSYKLRDWIFSRQRYWGEPIPLIHCPQCGVVPIPEEDLPLELPYVEQYQPTGTGESPLAAVGEWVNVKCPHCGGPARRETDTMPNWAGSCWYFLRFADPHNDEIIFDPAKTNPSESLSTPNQPLTSSSNPLESFNEPAPRPPGAGGWLPVDWYLGGAEHAVLHLLYARFWVKAMYDLGLVNFQEPFLRLRGVGMVQGEDGRKMSKSYGNVINPDDVVAAFGADTLRVYEMFMGPFGQAINWNTSGVEGAYRFLKKVWTLVLSSAPNQPLTSSSHPLNSSNSPLRSLESFNEPSRTLNRPLGRTLNRLIKKVGEDIEAIKFNTAIAAFMEFVSSWSANQLVGLSVEDVGIFLRLLAPFAPHITEELWQKIVSALPAAPVYPSIHQQLWPSYDPALLEEEEVTIIVQVDGKVRDRLTVKKGTARAELRNLAERQPNVKRFLSSRRIKEVYVVPNRLINFATG